MLEWLRMGDRAKTYHRWQLWLSLCRFGMTVAYLLLVLATGVSVEVRERLALWSPFLWLRLGVALIILGAGHQLLTAPLSWLQSFWLPRRFGILHQAFTGWCWDRVKGAMLGGMLALAAAEIVYGLLSVTPFWWLWAAAIFFAGSAVLARLVPTWIVPLFYRLTPLDDASLRNRLLELARRAGVPALGVWVADQSRKSKTANAALVGLGRTRRILLFDTLVQSFGADEVESVLAHELGHHVHGDIWRGLGFQGALTLVTFGLANGLLRLGSEWLGLNGPADLAGLPLFGLILVGLGLGAMPLGNGFSRWMEGQADDFALAVTGNPSAFVGAMERLAGLNLAERRPSRLKEFFFHSHPSIDRRIDRAKHWMGNANLGGVVP